MERKVFREGLQEGGKIERSAMLAKIRRMKKECVYSYHREVCWVLGHLEEWVLKRVERNKKRAGS